MLDAGYKVNVVPGEAVAHVDGRFLPGYEDEFFATLAELVGEGIEIDYVSNSRRSRPPSTGDLVDAMTASLLGRGPRRARRAVPDVRRHRRQALGQARHPLLRVHAAAGCPPTWTSPRCSTESTSGCPPTRWSSARGCSTGSSTRPDSPSGQTLRRWRMILRLSTTRRVPSGVSGAGPAPSRRTPPAR